MKLTRQPVSYLTILFALLTVTSVSHAQQYYKWTDRKGMIHYSQNPPPKTARVVKKVMTYNDRTTPVATAATTSNSTANVPAAASAHSQATPSSQSATSTSTNPSTSTHASSASTNSNVGVSTQLNPNTMQKIPLPPVQPDPTAVPRIAPN